MRIIAAAIVLSLAVTAGWSLKKKKKDEDFTQTLELPKDPPYGVTAETRRLMFHVSPLSAKGLLSQQTRDALKALLKANGGAQVVKIRAFVAGSGDMRRVPSIVSEVFTEHHLTLPAVSVVQSGGLPLEGAQVVLEATSLAKRDVAPDGLLFVSGQAASMPQPLQPTAPLAAQSLDNLAKVLAGSGAAPTDVLRLTCFTSNFDSGKIASLALAHYPQAAIDLVQTQRVPSNTTVECEAVARLPRPTQQPVEFRNADGLAASRNYSQAAAVSAPRIVLTGLQVAFGFQEPDARLAFQRLEKELQQLGSSEKEIAVANFYPLSLSIAEQVRKIRFDFFDAAHPPASTLLPFEGLPSMDASFAVEVVALASRPVVNQ